METLLDPRLWISLLTPTASDSTNAGGGLTPRRAQYPDFFPEISRISTLITAVFRSDSSEYPGVPSRSWPAGIPLIAAECPRSPSGPQSPCLPVATVCHPSPGGCGALSGE
jgi:hypothetical protein